MVYNYDEREEDVNVRDSFMNAEEDEDEDEEGEEARNEPFEGEEEEEGYE